jgi:hypothetical protein
MQTLTLATQNSIEQSDMGVGTSAVTFFRTLGGAIGAFVLGAILIAQERSSVAGDVVRYGPPMHLAAAKGHRCQGRVKILSVPMRRHTM